MRIRGRIDNNQVEIVKAIRAIGWSVAVTSSMGSGFPDIIVGARGRNFLFELKSKIPKNREPFDTLTKDQADFHLVWQGKIHIVDSIYAITEIINNWKL